MEYEFGVPSIDEAVGGIDPGTNILVTGPAMSGKESLTFCSVSEGVSNKEGVVYVSTQDSGYEILEKYKSVVREFYPDRFGVVDTVSQSRSMEEPEPNKNVKLANSPEDMTGIGVKASQFLDEFENRGVDRTRICLNSVSTFVMYSELQTVFRFLHVFTGKVRKAEGIGIYLMDSEMHDPKVYSTLKQLFDGVIKIHEDDEIEVNGIVSGTKTITDFAPEKNIESETND